MTFSSNDPTYMQRQIKEKPSGSQASSLVPRLSCFQLFITCSIEVESEYTFTHGTDILDPAFTVLGAKPWRTPLLIQQRWDDIQERAMLGLQSAN